MIPKYQEILYATDMEAGAPRVFRHALSVARAFGARVHIVHVIPEIEVSHQQYAASIIGEERFKAVAEDVNHQVLTRMRDNLRTFAAEELRDHPEELQAVASIEVLHGHPAERILHRAAELDADLLVFGGHTHHTPLDFLGTIVNRVLRRARRPVLVIPLRD